LGYLGAGGRGAARFARRSGWCQSGRWRHHQAQRHDTPTLGIDSPETRQTCADGWAAGPEATRKLVELIGVGDVTCEPRGLDRYRRTIALCRADGHDLGAAMVSAGMAYAFTRYSGDYLEQEKAAILSRTGVHAHHCEKPWDWRARNRVDR